MVDNPKTKITFGCFTTALVFGIALAIVIGIPALVLKAIF